MPTIDRFEAIVQKLAEQQHGIVSRQQLLDAKISRHVIYNRLRKGRLRQVAPGVFRTRLSIDHLGNALAACMERGPRAVLSRISAAELWGLLGDEVKRPVTLAVPRGRPRRGPVTIHLCGSLQPDECTRHRNIPTTNVARTIFDLAATGLQRLAEQALAVALRRDLVTVEQLRAMVTRHENRRGTLRVKKLLTDEAPAMTRSEAEEVMLALIRSAELPTPRVNQRVHGFEVDFYWPAYRLAVEVDGYAFHRSKHSFENDRTRDLRLETRGITVLRITWEKLTGQSIAVAALLAQVIAQRTDIHRAALDED